MAGAVVEAGRGGRKSVDSEINMIPMIDLLMVTISFLLITAVWVQAGRVEASAQVPGSDTPPCSGDCTPPRTLHLEMRDPARFALYWVENGAEAGRVDVPRQQVVESVGRARAVRYPGLKEALGQAWKERGVHTSPSDRALDRLVLHTDDASSYAEIIGAIDAAHAVTRPMTVGTKTTPVGALDVTFSAK